MHLQFPFFFYLSLEVVFSDFNLYFIAQGSLELIIFYEQGLAEVKTMFVRYCVRCVYMCVLP